MRTLVVRLDSFGDVLPGEAATAPSTAPDLLTAVRRLLAETRGDRP